MKRPICKHCRYLGYSRYTGHLCHATCAVGPDYVCGGTKHRCDEVNPWVRNAHGDCSLFEPSRLERLRRWITWWARKEER